MTAARWRARAARYVNASAPVEALRHWREVRALLHGIPETPETLTLRTQACAEILPASSRVGIAPAEVQEIFEEGCAGARKTGDARAFALLLIGYAAARQVIGDAPGYFRYTGEAARAAEQVDDESFRYALQSCDIIYSHALVGRLSEALHLADALLLRAGGNADLGAEVFGFSCLGFVQFQRCWFLLHLGRLSEAKEQLDRAVEFIRARGEPELLSWALGVYPVIEEASGEIGPGLRCAAEGVEISER